MSDQTTIKIPLAVRILTIAEWVFRHWLALLAVIFMIFNLLPILAPVAMNANQTAIGDGIYRLYGSLSHQWAHRSYFLFGEQVMYTPEELPVNIIDDFFHDGTALYQFIGNEQFGWKVAWSDRLVSVFGAGLITIFAYMLLRRRSGFRPLTRYWMLLLVLPLLIDGMTHIISEDNADALVNGFRWSNEWLATLTGNAFSPEFYTGDTFGSFNSWMRIITGSLFGIGVMAWGLGIADGYFVRNATILRGRLDNWWQRQQNAE